MVIEKTENADETQDTDNQGDSDQQDENAENQNESDKGENESEDGATSKTDEEGGEKSEDEKPEFSDENMQKKFTQRMQELSEKEKDYNEKLEGYEKMHTLIKRIDSDPELVSAIRKKLGGGKAADEDTEYNPTDEEILLAQNDAGKMKELISKVAQSAAQKAAKEAVAPVSSQVGDVRFENQIAAYADEEGNEDFDKLWDSGILKGQLMLVKQQNPRLDRMEQVKKAHEASRKLINSIKDVSDRDASEKAQGKIKDKKDASVPKGGKSGTAAPKSYKGKSILDIGQDMWS